jgi:hypothetical protein
MAVILRLELPLNRCLVKTLNRAPVKVPESAPELA